MTGQESPLKESSSAPRKGKKHGRLLRTLRRGLSMEQPPTKRKRRDTSKKLVSSPTENLPESTRTAIYTNYDPLQALEENPTMSESTTSTTTEQPQQQSSTEQHSFCGTAILQHSYHFCGDAEDVFDQSDDEEDEEEHHLFSELPEDPTIQESIECVFASQLEEGLPMALAPRGSLVHMGTFDPILGKVVPPQGLHVPTHATIPPSLHPHTACACQHGVTTPTIPPQYWPQFPLLLRPTPGTGMRIRGIRFSSSKQYLWEEGDATNNIQWYQHLCEHWNRPCPLPEVLPTTCPECLPLPINNGNEERGQALVVDFESPLFIGTILVRVRFTQGTTPQPYNDATGYFAGMNRRYQICVRGKFKEELQITKCVAGLQLERPCGNLPPKWITKGALRVVSFFAPQLKADFDCPRPYSLTPFGSTPQSLSIQNHAEADVSMEDVQHEPVHASHTLLGQALDNPSSLARARYRKRNFDKLYVNQSPTPISLTDKVYTFEFLQHLLDFHEFSVELGSVLGSVSMKETLDGQALQILAMHASTGRRIWAFDMWHESLVGDSQKYDDL